MELHKLPSVSARCYCSLSKSFIFLCCSQSQKVYSRGVQSFSKRATIVIVVCIITQKSVGRTHVYQVWRVSCWPPVSSYHIQFLYTQQQHLAVFRLYFMLCIYYYVKEWRTKLLYEIILILLCDRIIIYVLHSYNT